MGALRLRSRVELHLEQGSTLQFCEDPERYPPVQTRYEGLECVNRLPMLHAAGETDVAVTGAGTLDASLTSASNRGSDCARASSSRWSPAAFPPATAAGGREA